MTGLRRQAKVLRWVLLAAVFLTFSAERCSSKQKAPEATTSFVAGGEDAKTPEAKDKVGMEEEEEAPGEPVEAAEAAPAGPPEDAFVLAGGGDIILHGRVKGSADAKAADPGAGDDGKHAGWWYVFKNLEPVLDKASVTLANLETPIAKERKKPTGTPPVLNGPAEALGAMKEAGFGVLNLANNHAYDQKREGAGETVSAVLEAGMSPVGAGRSKAEADAPVYREAGGIKAAFLAWTVTLNNNFNELATKNKPWVNVYGEEAAADAVAAVRPSVDLVVASLHWGGEFDMKAGAKQKAIAGKLCGGGVDVILGHGPHILHEVELLDGPRGKGTCLVAYSLGNLLSNQGLKYRYGWNPPNLLEAKNIPYTRDGIILRVTVKKTGAGIRFDAIEAVPIWTKNNWIDRYTQKTVPPDDITIIPVIPAIHAIVENASKEKLLLEERLEAIKTMVGDAVTYVEL
jgi:hypothetical protein